MKLAKGLFFVTEGGDCSGKTTTLNIIKQWAEKSPLPIVFTKEPGGTAFGEQIRQLILDPHSHYNKVSAAYLFAAARQDHVRNVIAPALKAHEIVICDRYLLSSYAYQSHYVAEQSVKNLMAKKYHIGKPRYTDVNDVRSINKRAITYGNHVYLPDITFYFKLSQATQTKRLRGRQHKFDRYDQMVLHRQNQLRFNYRIAIAKAKKPVRIINGERARTRRAHVIWSQIKRMAHMASSNNTYQY